MSHFASSALRRIICCNQWALPHGPRAYIFHLWKQRTSPSDTSTAFLCPIKTSHPLLNAISSSLLILFSFLWPGFFPKVNFFLPPLHHVLYPIFPQACFKKWPVLTANSISQIPICLLLLSSIIQIKLSLHLSVTLWIFFAPHVPEVQCLYLMPTDLLSTLLHFLACLKLPHWYVHWKFVIARCYVHKEHTYLED